MPTPRLTSDAVKFVRGMQDKHARQVLMRIIELAGDPFPQDHRKLHGYRDMLRVDAGEYRIVYRVDGDMLIVLLVGKRNDDEVYRRASRKQRLS
jgi:mRNA interferase RelE/StbE